MTLSIDDLRQLYGVAYQTKLDGYDYDETLVNCIAEAERAGIRAVVTALRDECDTHIEQRLRYGAGGGDVWNFFSEILAPRGDEAAGTDTAEVNPEAIERSAPAAAPDDADVCEWKREFQTAYTLGACGRSCYGWPHYEKCLCGKPIRIVEAAR